RDRDARYSFSCPVGRSVPHQAAEYSQLLLVHHDRPHLHRPIAGRRDASRERDRLIEIFCFDQVVTAELFAGFSERAIGRDGFAIAHPHRGRSGDRLQGIARAVVATLHDALGERHVLWEYRAFFLFTHGVPVSLALVDQQQVLHVPTSLEIYSLVEREARKSTLAKFFY